MLPVSRALAFGGESFATIVAGPAPEGEYVNFSLYIWLRSPSPVPKPFASTDTTLWSSDNTGLLEIFGKTLTLKLVGNKLEVSDKLAAKDFKYGAEDRDYLLKWLYNEMMENKR